MAGLSRSVTYHKFEDIKIYLQTKTNNLDKQLKIRPEEEEFGFRNALAVRH